MTFTKIQELHKAHEAYEELLTKEIESMIGLASIHGWKSDNIRAGEEARRRIDQAYKEAITP